MSKFLKAILIFFGIWLFVLVFGFVVGFPTWNDLYIETESKKTNIEFVKASTFNGEVVLIPEVLNRLILEIKFSQDKDNHHIIKDLNVLCKCNSSDQIMKRIFDIRISKYDPTFDGYNLNETRIKERYEELPIKSKYRNLSYTIIPQFELNDCSNFDLNIAASFIDTLVKKDIIIKRKYIIEKEIDFKWEHFRAH